MTPRTAVKTAAVKATPTAPNGADRTPPSSLWVHYAVELKVARLVAGVPATEKAMTAWLDKHGIDGPDRKTQLSQLEREGISDAHSVVFYREGDQPYLEGRCIKALLKEAANILKDMMGVRAFRSKLAERVFVREVVVPITSPIQSAERPISVMTMQGPRTSLKSYEFAEDVRLKFRLRVLNDGLVTEEHLRTLLEYGKDNGLGSDRSQGAGTYDLLRFERV